MHQRAGASSRAGRGRCVVVLAVLAVSLLLVAGAAARSSGSAHRGARRGAHHKHKRPKPPPPPEVTLPAALAGPAAPVTMSPVGLSLEYPVMAHDLGSGACPPPALAAKLLQLGSPPLSLAGASQDMTAPSGSLTGAPGSWEAATLYELPADFWSRLHCLLGVTKDPLTAGINLKTGQLAWAQQIVAGAESAATAGVSFSLGNEPDLYGLPNYEALDKPQVDEEALEAGLYLRLAGAMSQALEGAALVGPEVSRPSNWEHVFPHVLEALHPQTVGVHMYPLTSCRTPRTATIGGLLSPQAASAPTRLAWVVADATAAHLPAIISEANSVSCGGRFGVSDDPAAAVWAARFVLSALKTGFREVSFHFSGGPYDPFVVSGETVTDRPLDSALLALERWLPISSSLQSATIGHGLLATRIGEPGGGTMLVLDNETAHDHPVLVRAAGVHMETLSTSRAGVQAATLRSARGRIRLTIARESLVAIGAG